MIYGEASIGEEGEYVEPVNPDRWIEKRLLEDGVINTLIQLRGQLMDTVTWFDGVIPYCFDTPLSKMRSYFTAQRDKAFQVASELNALIPEEDRADLSFWTDRTSRTINQLNLKLAALAPPGANTVAPGKEGLEQ